MTAPKRLLLGMLILGLTSSTLLLIPVQHSYAFPLPKIGKAVGPGAKKLDDVPSKPKRIPGASASTARAISRSFVELANVELGIRKLGSLSTSGAEITGMISGKRAGALALAVRAAEGNVSALRDLSRHGLEMPLLIPLDQGISDVVARHLTSPRKQGKVADVEGLPWALEVPLERSIDARLRQESFKEFFDPARKLEIVAYGSGIYRVRHSPRPNEVTPERMEKWLQAPMFMEWLEKHNVRSYSRHDAFNTLFLQLRVGQPKWAPRVHSLDSLKKQIKRRQRQFYRKQRKRNVILERLDTKRKLNSCQAENDFIARNDLVETIQSRVTEPELREAIFRIYFGNERVREVAQDLCVKPNTLSRKLSRQLKRLKA